MTSKLLIVLTTALVVGYGAMGAQAQQSRNTPMAQNQEQNRSDQQGSNMGRQNMTGMMGDGMMGDGMMGGRMMGHGHVMSPLAMRIIFILMDADGDGTVSLQEFQAAHERIFKAMDTDKDGTLTLEEFQAFMHGGGQPAQKH